MKIIAVTGSVASGKSFITNCFKELGYKTFDSDMEVRNLLLHNIEIKTYVKDNWPELIDKDNNIKRDLLATKLFANKNLLIEWESLLYPLINKARERFLAEAKQAGEKVVILEVALLFEKKLEKICDYIIVTYIDSKTQYQRALLRDDMTAEKLEKIINLQLPDHIKKEKADFVIDTSQTKDEIIDILKQILRKII